MNSLARRYRPILPLTLTLIVEFVALTTGCTTLGPMPATTAVSAVPAGRPDAEFQLAAVPGYYLSSSVRQAPTGAGISHLSMLVEPDKLIGVPGLIIGGRAEAMAGYRGVLDHGRRLDSERVSL